MRKHEYVEIRTTGGAISQLLGLSNAIYLKNKLGVSFKICHFVFGVGTKYPFALRNLLSEDEILDLHYIHRGYKNFDSLSSGMLVPNGPQQKISFEKMYNFVRGTSIDKKIKWLLRNERILDGKLATLDRIRISTKRVSGNFVSLSNEEVMNDLIFRFKSFKEFSPFEFPREPIFDILIHYRIGDLRLKYAFPTTKGDGVVSPLSLAQVVQSIPNHESMSIGVVSDSPKLAKELLQSVGVLAEIPNKENNLWLDMQHMIHARTFIGTHSQVTSFASSVRYVNSKESYNPSNNSLGVKSIWKTEASKGYFAEYLKEDHTIFSEEANNENNPTYDIYNWKK